MIFRSLIAVLVLMGICAPACVADAGQPTVSTSSPGGIALRLIGTPNEPNNPLARVYIIDRLAPGTVLQDHIEVDNTTHSVQAISVYPAAAAVHHGTFGFTAGRTQNALSSWTTVSQGLLHLAPGSSVDEMVTIAVPSDSPPGPQYAVIWGQVSRPESGVTLVNRVGIRMYLTVGRGGGAPPNFKIARPAAERSASGHPLVVTKVTNNANGTLDINGTLMLTDGPGGLRIGPYRFSLGPVLTPGASEQAISTLHKGLPAGPWRAQLNFSSGAIKRGVSVALTFPTRETHHSSGRSGYLPLVLIGALVITLAGMTFALLRRRKSKPQQ